MSQNYPGGYNSSTQANNYASTVSPNYFTKNNMESSIDLGKASDAVSGNISVDVTKAAIQKLLIDSPVNIAFVWPNANVLSSVILKLVNGGSNIVSLPNSIKWEIAANQTYVSSLSEYLTAIGRNPATLRTNDVDQIIFWTSDNGTTVYAKII